MIIKGLYISDLYLYLGLQLLALVAVVWFLFGAFLFLVCFSVSVFIRSFVAEITNKKNSYGTSKKAHEN